MNKNFIQGLAGIKTVVKWCIFNLRTQAYTCHNRPLKNSISTETMNLTLTRICCLLTFLLLSLPETSSATRLVDLQTPFSRLLANGCVTEKDRTELGFARYKKGFQANFHSEKDFVRLIDKVYNCRTRYETGYFIYGRWEKDEQGKQKTISDSINRDWTQAWKLDNGLAIFSNYEEAVQSHQYRSFVDSYGVENTFLQKIDFLNSTEAGLFDSSGMRVD